MTRVLTFILLVSLAVCSCKTLAPSAQGNEMDVAAAMERLANRNQLLQSAAGESGLEFNQDGRHERVELSWVLQKPNQATLELVSPVGLMAAATIDGDTFRYYDVRGKRFVQGPATESSLSRLLPWPILPSTMVPMLLGTPEILKGVHLEPDYDSEMKHWRQVVVDPQGNWKQSFWFNPDGLLYHVRLTEKGKGIVYDTRYLGWKTSGKDQPEFPGFMKISHPRSHTTVSLKTGSYPEINTSFDEDIFHLPIPDGVAVEMIQGD